MATNEAGVVAGLTNRPLRDGPDAAKRSRGELPLALAAHPTAAAAVEAFGTAIDPGAYNPSWLLVADRNDVFFVDVTGTDEVIVEHLRPGVHVLENRDLHEPSPKAERVRELLDPALHGQDTSLLEILPTLLADHEVPPGEPPAAASNPRLAVAARAICVHADEDDYGTRSSAIITVDDQPARRTSAGPATPRATADGSVRTPSGRDPLASRTLRARGRSPTMSCGAPTTRGAHAKQIVSATPEPAVTHLIIRQAPLHERAERVERGIRAASCHWRAPPRRNYQSHPVGLCRR